MKPANKKKLEKYEYTDYKQCLTKHWEECDPEYAHLEANKWRGGEAQVFSEHRLKADLLKQHVNLDGLTILDYGIGDGLWGCVLLSEYNIKKYVGIDIAKRTLDKAHSNLSEKGWSFKLEQTPANFLKYKPDVITSFACIQHFPDCAYLDDFCHNILNAAPSIIMLQIRRSDKWEENFSPNTPSLACTTTPKHILDRLPHYKFLYRSEIASNGYQLFIMSKIKND